MLYFGAQSFMNVAHSASAPDKVPVHQALRAGRLDKDSEGLLVLTNDGDLAHRLTHPSTEIVKRYRVVLHRDFKKEDIYKLLTGTKYEDDFLKAEKVIPAPLEGEGHKRRLEVHLHHGKKREVRRQ